MKIFYFIFLLLISMNNYCYADFGEWTEPLDISTETASIPSTKIAMDSSGHAVVIWQEMEDSTNYYLKVAYSADYGETWSEPSEPISSTTYTGAIDLAVANQHAIIIWRESNRIYYTYGEYSEGSGYNWSTPERISDDVYSLEPQVAMNDSGCSVVIWRQLSGFNGFVIANYSQNYGKSWNENTQVCTSTSGYLKVAINESGNAVALWQYDSKLLQSSYTTDLGASWSALEQISTSGYAAREPALAVNGNHIVAAWAQYNGTAYDIYANYSTFEGTWATPFLVQTENSTINFVDLSMNSEGNAIIAWNSHITTTANAYYYYIKTASSSDYGVNFPVITTITEGSNSYPNIAVNDTYALLIYQEDDSNSQTYIASTYSSDAGNNWSTSVPISTSSTDSIIPSLTMDSYNNALAVWGEGSSFKYIIQSSCSRDAAIELTGYGEKKAVPYLLFTNLQNIVVGNPIDIPGTYYLYRDAGLTNLIESIHAENSSVYFYDNFIQLKETKTYYMEWISDAEKKAGPIEITIIR